MYTLILKKKYLLMNKKKKPQDIINEIENIRKKIT